MRFFDLCIDCEDSARQNLCEVARRYGYSGIAFTNHGTISDYELEYADLEVFRGIEIVLDASKLKERIKKYRPKVDVLVVHGGDEVINRIAVGERMVDVLNHPRNGLNHVVARLAAKNKVAIGFDIGNIIHKRGGARSKALSEMRKNLILARRYGTPIILSSNAHSIYDLRAPREVIALTRLFGMKREEAVRALSEIPSMIVEKVMMNGK